MKKLFPVLTFLFLLSLIAPANVLASPDSKPNSSQNLSGGDVIIAINGYRQQYGLAQLTPNSLLTSLAQGQSDYQASIGSITHTGPGGTTPQQRASAAGYGGGNFFYLSEIIYGGYQQNVQNALSWWQNSSLHNSIMLSSNYSEIGAGVATSGDSVYFTAVLGGPSGSSSSTSGSGDDSGSGENPQPTAAGPVVMPVQKATPQPDGSIIHTVLTGQTLWTIAAVYEIKLEDVYELNGLNRFSFVFPGDEILVRPPGDYSDSDPDPTKIDQSEESGTDQMPIATQMVGEAFSYSAQTTPQPTSTPRPRPTLLPTPTEAPQETALFADDPTARNLIIGALIILIIVMVGSMFFQSPSKRPPEENTGE